LTNFNSPELSSVPFHKAATDRQSEDRSKSQRKKGKIAQKADKESAFKKSSQSISA